MAREREDKLKRYKEKKSIDEQLKSLKIRLDASEQNEDLVRDYYLTLLQSSIRQR